MNKKICRENIVKMLQFPNDDQIDLINEVKSNIEKVVKFLENSENTWYLENSKKRMKESLAAFDEGIFWLEKNRKI